MTTTQDTRTPTVESVWDAVAGVRQTLRWLGSLDLGFLLDEDVDALLPEVEEAARVVPVVQQALTAQVMDRGLAETHGCTSPTAYLQANCGCAGRRRTRGWVRRSGSSRAPA